MTQDFAKRPRKRKRTRSRSTVPGWVWLFTGTILGAFITFLVYLADLKPSQKNAAASPKKAEQPATNTVAKPRFDFYTLLRESEVIVPGTQPTSTNPTIENDPAKPEQKFHFILQVGSFKNQADADRLRAQLILMNLQANIEKVEVRPGENWHRVLVGPFEKQSSLSSARNTLASNNIDTLLLKRKTP